MMFKLFARLPMRSIWYYIVGVFLMIGLSGCSDGGEQFVQQKPTSSQLAGLWNAQYVPRSLQERYGIPDFMEFRLNEDGTVLYESFSFIDLDNKVWAIDSDASWSLSDANPLNKASILIKWEVLLLFQEPNYGVALAVKERDGQLVLSYEWVPDNGAITFVRSP